MKTKCMQCGGSTKMKKMKTGGSMGIVGMPKYSNDPRTDAGRTLKKGGVVKKYQDGGSKPRIEARPTKSSSPISGATKRSKPMPTTKPYDSSSSRTIASNRTKPSSTPKVSSSPTLMRTNPLTSMKVDTKTIAPVAVNTPVEKPTLKQKIGQKLVNTGSKMQMKMGGSSFGMLSVKAGVDKNPNPTAADRIAGAKMKKAKFGASVKVQHSPDPGRVRSSSGTGTVPVGMRKKKSGSVKK
jgi:hypothetical protein